MTDHDDQANVHGNDDEMPAELRLHQPDAEAAFTPSHGFWCTSFRARVNGMWLRVFGEPSSWKALTTRPTFFGNPLLFPYPLQVRGGAFGYRGKRYTVRAGSEGYPIHGLVRDHEWTVERTWSDQGGAHVRASIEYSPADDPDPEFPFPFRFAATYTLSGTMLFLDVEATNTGSTTMPLGLGIHPYVSIPLVPGGRFEDCVVTSDVTDLAVYEGDFANVRLEPVSGWRDLRSGARVSDLLDAHKQFGQKGASLATLYARFSRQSTSVAGEPGGIDWSLTDVANGISVRIETSDAFQTMVHYSPPTPTVISPVIGTLMPNGFNLADAGQPSGLIELEPGALWRAWTRISVGRVER